MLTQEIRVRAGYVPPGEVARYKPPGARARDGGTAAVQTRAPAAAGVPRPAERRREAASGASADDAASGADGLAAALASVKLGGKEAASTEEPAVRPHPEQEAASRGGGS